MPIPKTRRELIDLVDESATKLLQAIDDAEPSVADLPCIDEWSVKDLLAVRLWWTEHVLEWIDAGRRGEIPALPAPGYAWNETPRLNNDIVIASQAESYASIRRRLKRGIERVRSAIDELDDRELLEAGVFEWAGRWPIARWISINTARQYTTARTHIRKAQRRDAP
jgi:hypothetical protein